MTAHDPSDRSPLHPETPRVVRQWRYGGPEGMAIEAMPASQAMSSQGSRVLTATLQDHSVLLSFRLGIADGITLLCRRPSETDFLTVAEDEDGPVVDCRPKLDPDKPETRIYIAILYYDDGETLRLTNEVRITLP